MNPPTAGKRQLGWSTARRVRSSINVFAALDTSSTQAYHRVQQVDGRCAMNRAQVSVRRLWRSGPRLAVTLVALGAIIAWAPVAAGQSGPTTPPQGEPNPTIYFGPVSSPSNTPPIVPTETVNKTPQFGPSASGSANPTTTASPDGTDENPQCASNAAFALVIGALDTSCLEPVRTRNTFRA